MIIKDLTNGRDVDGEIERLTKADFKWIKKSRTFEFNWDEYSQQEVYKLVVRGTKEILGLMCIEDRSDPAFNCLEIVAIETRLDQRGKKKTYDRIAGCLFGFAARLAFKNGHEGMIFLIAKTKTAELFHKRYGFDYLGNINSVGTRMASEENNSQRLISNYL
jgi:hypothetical protein